MAVEGVSISLSQWAGLAGPNLRAPVEHSPPVKTVAPSFDEASARPVSGFPPPVQKGDGSAESNADQTSGQGADQRGDSAQNQGGSLFGELTDKEEAIVAALRRQDAEVKRHERAHAAAGGPYTGLPVYQYTQGPDGKRYAVSGEVSIDASPQSTPEATIAKMEVVIRAALAPAEPSAQDRSVAAQAQRTKAEAEAQLREEKLEESREASEADSGSNPFGIIPAASASAAYRIAEVAFASNSVSSSFAVDA
ncbi:MAG: putative metalloprotease CJM1_0395 family protein [Rhodospirillales bacterium]|nr:putative metalloprotease CJM1_0395 family protein [Rhodospirillales bacterium]